MLKETKNVRDDITTGDMEYTATYRKEGIFNEIMGHLVPPQPNMFTDHGMLSSRIAFALELPQERKTNQRSVAVTHHIRLT